MLSFALHPSFCCVRTTERWTGTAFGGYFTHLPWFGVYICAQ
jgi:hypothetical protein